MTTKTWNGSNGNFTDAGSWSPNGVPVSGDLAIINAGTVALATTPSGVTIQLVQPSGASNSASLTLNGATLDPSSPLIVNNQNTYTNTSPTISVSGTSSITGTESFYGSKISFVIAGGSTLVNTGTMNFYSSSPVTTGGGTFQNSGILALVNPAATPQIPIFNDAVTGNGTIALGAHARIEVAGPIAAGQTVLFNDGASGGQTLQIDQPSTFGATINGFSRSDLIAVTNTPYTSFNYTSTSANSGVLQLLNGGAVVGSLNFAGSYQQSDFQLTFNDFGGGQSNLGIATTAVNAQSGGLPNGYQNGGNGALPVYRFFDTRFGTHFFTSDTGERDTVKATRPDLVEETNGFGDVVPSDPNSVAVYRFFDKNFGTHFFTASATERDTVINTRPDLTYEQNSTFYEHGTQQAGDAAVYRLFDQRTGTQFLTGDQGEYNGITTPGSTTYRADLKSEGVAFYAPTGSFT